jgi:hypothetical protein
VLCLVCDSTRQSTVFLNSEWSRVENSSSSSIGIAPSISDNPLSTQLSASSGWLLLIVVMSDKANERGGMDGEGGPLKKQKGESKQRGGFKWDNDSQKNFFVRRISKHDAYKPTTGLSFETKFQQVIEDCKKAKEADGVRKMFPDGFDVKWESAQKSFRRMTDSFMLKAGISEEGANLSGKAEDLTDTESHLYDMEMDREKSLGQAKNDRERKEEFRKRLEHHEKENISAQGGKSGRSSMGSLATSTADERRDNDSASETASASGSTQKAGKQPPKAFGDSILEGMKDCL